MAGSHIIGKQIWELRISSAENAYTVQQAVSEMIWKELVPELNTLFDSIAAQDEVIILDKIELDLGTIMLTTESRLQIINRILKSLQEECFQAKMLSQNQEAFKQRKANTGTLQSLGQYHFENWIYWLETGTLPSYALAPNEQWLLLVLETLGLEYRAVNQLQETIKKFPHALRRLVLQHKEKDLKSIVELFTGHTQTKLPGFFKEIQKLLKQEWAKASKKTIREMELTLWEFIFKKVILNREKLSSEKLTAAVIAHPDLWSFNVLFQNKGKAITKRYPLLHNAYKQAQVVIKNTEDQSPTNKASLHGEPEQKPTSQKYEFLEEKQHNFLKSEDQQSGTKTTALQQEPKLPVDDRNDSSPQFFNNAGLVLLHPFLKQLFMKLKIVKDGAFKNFEKQSKAVLLLQYLATGQVVFGDYEMVLPKLLCGMPANLPMDHLLKLSKKEKREANDLLKAVIQHWGALGSTSSDGLREGFLMREGKLIKEGSGWKLYVAQNAMDLLLDRIPWNLSMIKLPWMKELLYVEWR